MSERGVFAVDRGIWDHPILADNAPFSRREAWIWLISEAAWKPHRVRRAGQFIELQRGQVAHSLRHLADVWGWSVKKVRHFLDTLNRAQMVAHAGAQAVTVITICKYEDYQRVSLPKETTSPTPKGTAGAQEGHGRGTIREDKENKEGKEDKSSLRSDRRTRAKARTPLPDDWQPDEQDSEYACGRGFTQQQIGSMASAFANHHRAKGSLMADWHAAWRTWCENEIKFQGNGQHRATGPPAKKTVHDAANDLLERMRAFDDKPNDLQGDVCGGTGQAPVRRLSSR